MITIKTKFVLYNAISKAIIIAAIGLLLPVLIEKVVFLHIDKRLQAREDRIFAMIERGGIKEIILEQDCSFESYNILKEEFVSIEPLPELPQNLQRASFSNENIIIEDENIEHRVITVPFIFDNQLYQLKIGEGLTAIDELKRTIREFTIWLTLIMIFITVLTDAYFSKVLMQPFYKIIRTKLNISTHPDSFQRTKVETTTKEFAHLDNSINNMMQKVQDAFRIEREFIANASHELLTPVSILKTRLENLLPRADMPEEVADKIVDSLNTLERMTKIIRSLLLISKIENHQYLKNDTVTLKEIISEIIYEFEERMEEKQIQLSQQWQQDLHLQGVNKSLLFTLFFNIISNAIKYNHIAGEIKISGYRTNENIVIEVTDTGTGIDSKNLQNLYKRFNRFDKLNEGYGLGLPIVKTIADFHQATIQAESEAGKGTTFRILFPVQYASTASITNVQPLTTSMS